jgi:hypothetical protein
MTPAVAMRLTTLKSCKLPQCGIQVPLCSAFGGINYIEISNSVGHGVTDSDTEQHLVGARAPTALVYLAVPDSPSCTGGHKELENEGPESPRLEARWAAEKVARCCMKEISRIRKGDD